VRQMPVSRLSKFPRLSPRLLATGLALVVAGLPLAGCKEAEEESAAGYVPEKLEEIKNSDLHRISWTAEAAERTGLKTAAVRRSGAGVSVPYKALIYDAEGKTYVYTSPKSLSYLREEVKVDRITEDRVQLEKGPSAGTEVVTVGAAEVHGSELEVGGSH
jgi:hypothetical protein